MRQTLKPRNRKNIIAILFLLLYSDQWRLRGRRLALSMCVNFILIASSLRLAVAVNAPQSNDLVVEVNSGRGREFSTSPSTTTAADKLVSAGTGSTLLDRLAVITPATAVNGVQIPKQALDKQAMHRLRYSQLSAGVYSSHLQHLDDDDDYNDKDDEEEGGDGTFPHAKKNITGRRCFCFFRCFCVILLLSAVVVVARPLTMRGVSVSRRGGGKLMRRCYCLVKVLRIEWRRKPKGIG